MTGTSLQTQNDNQPPSTVRGMLAHPSMKKKFEEVLGKKAPQFMASITQASTSQALMRCDPMSVIASAFTAASLDLPIDKNLGFSHLVPYGGKAQFQMGYKGYIQLALRTGQYAALNDFIVNKEAFIDYNSISGELKIDHSKVGVSEDVVGYGFYFRLITGFEKTAYWSKEKIEKHAIRYSQAYKAKRKSSPWFTDFNTMALKTVISHTLRKYGILSIEMQTAMRFDQSARSSINGEPEYTDNGEGGFMDKFNDASDDINSKIGEEPTETKTTEPDTGSNAVIEAMTVEQLKTEIAALSEEEQVAALQAADFTNMPTGKGSLHKVLLAHVNAG